MAASFWIWLFASDSLAIEGSPAALEFGEEIRRLLDVALRAASPTSATAAAPSACPSLRLHALERFGGEQPLRHVEIIDDAPEREPVPMIGARDAARERAQPVEPDQRAHREIGVRRRIDRDLLGFREQHDLRRRAEQRQDRHILRHVLRHAGARELCDPRFGRARFQRRDEAGEAAFHRLEAGAIGLHRFADARHSPEAAR